MESKFVREIKMRLMFVKTYQQLKSMTVKYMMKGLRIDTEKRAKTFSKFLSHFSVRQNKT